LAFAPGILHADLFLNFNHHPYANVEVGELGHIEVRYVGHGRHLAYGHRKFFDPVMTCKFKGFPASKNGSSHEVAAGGWCATMAENTAGGLHGLPFTLDFDASEPGTGPLLQALIATVVTSEKTEPHSSDIGGQSSISVVGPAVSEVPSPVPEPSAALLLATALAGAVTRLARLHRLGSRRDHFDRTKPVMATHKEAGGRPPLPPEVHCKSGPESFTECIASARYNSHVAQGIHR